MTEAATPVALYRHFDAQGRLLYVGITKNPRKRWQQHRQHSPWVVLGRVDRVTVEWFPSRAAAGAAERRAIVTENPEHNSLRPLRGEALRRAQREYGVTPPEDLEWLSATEAAALLHVPERAVFDLSQGKIRRLLDSTRPALREQLRYNAEDVRALAAGR